MLAGNQLRANNNRLESHLVVVGVGGGVHCPGKCLEFQSAIIENLINWKVEIFEQSFLLLQQLRRKISSVHQLSCLDNVVEMWQCNTTKSPSQASIAITGFSQPDLKCNFKNQLRFGCGALKECRV